MGLGHKLPKYTLRKYSRTVTFISKNKIIIFILKRISELPQVLQRTNTARNCKYCKTKKMFNKLQEIQT